MTKTMCACVRVCTRHNRIAGPNGLCARSPVQGGPRGPNVFAAARITFSHRTLSGRRADPLSYTHETTRTPRRRRRRRKNRTLRAHPLSGSGFLGPYTHVVDRPLSVARPFVIVHCTHSHSLTHTHAILHTIRYDHNTRVCVRARSPLSITARPFLQGSSGRRETT